MFSGIDKMLSLIKSAGIYSNSNKQVISLINSIGNKGLAEQLVKSNMGNVSKLLYRGLYSPGYDKANLLTKVLGNQPYQLAIQSAMAGIGNLEKQRYLNDLFTQNERLSSLFYKQNQFIGILNSISPILESKIYSQQLRGLVNLYAKATTGSAIGAAILEEEEKLDIAGELTDRLTEAVSEIYQRGFYTADDIAGFLGYLAKHKEWTFFIIGLILQFLSWRYPYNPEPSETDRKMQQNNQTIIDTLQQNYNKDAVNKKLNKAINLRAEASIKSKSLGIVPAGTTVYIYDVEADWAFINYWDESRKCFISGWISAKYFAKETFSKKFKRRIKSNHLITS